MKMMTPDEIIRQCPRLIKNIERARLMQYWGEYLCGERISADSDIDTRALFITIFEDEKANKKFKGEHSLTSWAHHILKTDAPTKTDTPWLKLAEFGNLKTEKNCLRHDANVQQITGIEVDYDGEQISFEQACDTIRDAGIRALLYTSASHTKEKPRWRILVPLSKDYPPSSRAPMVGRINGLFNGSLAPESFVLSTSYHYGSVNHNPHHQAVVVDGGFLDLNDRLHAGSIDQYGHRVGDKEFEQTKSKPEQSREPGNAFSEYNSNPTNKNEIIAALAVIDPDCGWRLWYKLASAIWYELRDEGEEVFHSFSARSAKYNKKQCEKKWSEAVGNTLHSAGTIFYQATLANPDWRDEYERAESSDWIDADSEAPRTDQGATSPFEVYWHGIAYDRAERPWLVKRMIPEQGAGLISGQWGTAKTFVTMALSGSVMTGHAFAGHDVARRGGVLFIAAEGAGEVSIRLEAMARQFDHEDGALPFAWIEDTPDLKDNLSYRQLTKAVVAIGEQIKVKFGVDLTLIVVDTMSAAANWKDHNDAAEGQLVMNRLNELGRKAGAFVLAVDHFGKDASTGTRGTSAKEAAADVVLATLGDRDLNGVLSKTRMAIRKLRGGKTGEEFPFDLEVVPAGFGETTCIITWKISHAAADTGATSEKVRWPMSLRVFRTSMQAMVSDKGKSIRPYGMEGPSVMAVVQADVRTEFIAAYPVDEGGKREQNAAKRSAFNRALKDARARELVASREINGVDMIWFAKD